MAGSLGRKRVRTTRVAIQGGGSVVTGTANLSWGPAFGRGVGQEELQCGVHSIPIDDIQLESLQTCGCHSAVDAWDAVYSANTGGNVGASLTGAGNDLNLLFDFVIPTGGTCGCSMNSVANLLDMDFGTVRTCGCHPSVDQLDLQSQQTTGAHLSGTAVGAPFWMSEAHNFGASGSTAAITVNTPSGTVDGDLLLAFASLENPVAVGIAGISQPSGWTEHTELQSTGTAAAFRAGIWFRTAASEPASYDWAPSNTTHNGLNVEVHRIAGANTTTPIDVSGFALVVVGDLQPDPAAPTVTTTQAGCLVFAFLAHNHAALNQSHTPPAGHLERTDFENTSATILGQSSLTKVFGSAGATGTVSFNCSETVGTDAFLMRVAIAPGTTTLAA